MAVLAAIKLARNDLARTETTPERRSDEMRVPTS